MENKQNLVNFIIPVLSALLAFFGAIGGSYLSSAKSEELWSKSLIYNAEKVVLEKKIDLIERVSKVANSSLKYQAHQRYLNEMAVIAKTYESCNNKSECEKPVSREEFLRISTVRAELNAEFSSTLKLISLYFGDDVDVPLLELSRKEQWWSDSRREFEALIKAMTKEV
ncbi:hypothetical protein [Ferrimonas aestuarii]|uniref:Uncharacterized protein n=1 Tax=Ferrimonas aestuarii TaxID=2569539 RepID=A0A4U1BGD0_9GAMM|nr:hypothetical protein [Ferrimonas aestuarii]TKB50025.1 hypothetical protein FCL42_19765 [Ferrimonas aestuarii]